MRTGRDCCAPSARPARSACTPCMAIATRWCATCGRRRESTRPRSVAPSRPIPRAIELVRRFATLYDALDSTNSTNAKVAAMQAYFAEAPPADAAWALFFLTGGRLKRLIAARLLATWGCERARVPGWLFEESFGLAGDLAEGIALLRDAERNGHSAPGKTPPLSRLIEDRLLPLRDAPEEQKRRAGIEVLG